MGFLDSACGGDADLRAEVEGMLAADEQAEDHLDGLIAAVAEATAETTPAASTPSPPLQIGPYRVLDTIGHGGMSTVYLAERDDQHYQQRVAIKLVRLGPGAGEMRLHLRRERQILAGLDHPNIAKLLDGGNTADNLPYFVMDLVEGSSIDRYCAEQGLGVDERIRLFLDVCAAVEYAHANLVIHRDVKPSNILVTQAGSPKLLDFGIAKLLETDPETSSPDLATPTATGLRLLTPEYASPEQVRGDSLTIATDVYSLGVLLFELLTGERPLAADLGRGRDLEQAILEGQPRRASEVAATSPTGETLARAEGSGERLRRRLEGDLDNIVGMALRKEPERRYASVERLADDLRRHLDGRPVGARPDTLRYRVGKFVGRHRGPVVAAALAVLVVVALVFFYTQRLKVERDRALREERESAQVARLLVDLFATADPEVHGGETLDAREILALGATRLRAELADQGELRADLLEHIATIYLRLGLYEPAEPLLAEVQTLRHQLLADDDPGHANVLHLRGRWLEATDRFDEAEEAHRHALALREAALGSDAPEVADSLTDLANLFFANEDFDAAGKLFRRALDLRRRVLEPDDPRIATSLNDLGTTIYRQRDFDTAEPLLSEALNRRLEHFGEIHPAVAQSSSTLASVTAGRGDYGRAQALFAQALVIRRQVYGSDHPVVGVSLNNLGYQLRIAGDPAAAEPLLREAVELYRDRSTHRVTLRNTVGNLAETLRSLDRPGEAANYYREALEISRQLGDDRAASTVLWKLGDCHLADGDLDAAEDAYRQMLALRLAAHPEDHPRVASPRVFLARVLLAKGDPTGAAGLLVPTLGVLEVERPDHWLTAEASILLAECRLIAGDHPHARGLLTAGLAILERDQGKSAPAREARQRLLRRANQLRARLAGGPG